MKEFAPVRAARRRATTRSAAPLAQRGLETLTLGSGWVEAWGQRVEGDLLTIKGTKEWPPDAGGRSGAGRRSWSTAWPSTALTSGSG
jgi:hypothetical protein